MIQLCRQPYRLRLVTAWWTYPTWCKKHNRTRRASTITRISIRKCKSTTVITIMAAKGIRHQATNRTSINRWAAMATMPAVAMAHVAAHRSEWMHRTIMMITMTSSHRWHTRQSICRSIITLIKCVLFYSETQQLHLSSMNQYLHIYFLLSVIVFAVVEQFPWQYVQRFPQLAEGWENGRCNHRRGRKNIQGTQIG